MGTKRLLFGNRNAVPVVYKFFNDATPDGAGHVSSRLEWSLFSVASLSFATRLVIVKASRYAWDRGQEYIAACLGSIMAPYWPGLGKPTSVNRPDAGSTETKRSIWILSSPDDVHHIICLDEFDHQISWVPVFSLNPDFPRGSRDALCTLFPENALDGLHMLEQEETDFGHAPPRTSS